MKRLGKRLGALVFGPLLILVVVGVASGSSNVFDDTTSTCTSLNCSSLRIPGTVLSFGTSAGAFVINAFATPNQCLRLDVISEGADLEMVTVAPNGSVFRNDDKFSGGCNTCPLVKINPTPSNGWYTVRIGHFAGSGVDTNFVLLYGRYNAGNPNCAPPTPAASTADTFKAQDDDGEAPRPGQPGHE